MIFFIQILLTQSEVLETQEEGDFYSPTQNIESLEAIIAFNTILGRCL